MVVSQDERSLVDHPKSRGYKPMACQFLYVIDINTGMRRIGGSVNGLMIDPFDISWRPRTWRQDTGQRERLQGIEIHNYRAEDVVQCTQIKESWERLRWLHDDHHVNGWLPVIVYFVVNTAGLRMRMNVGYWTDCRWYRYAFICYVNQNTRQTHKWRSRTISRPRSTPAYLPLRPEKGSLIPTRDLWIARQYRRDSHPLTIPLTLELKLRAS